ncbi:hypothetical protein SLA2020_421090 [Shorea laevis]
MESSRKIQKLSIVEDDGFLLFEQLLEHLEDSDLELVASIARHIWLRRNLVVFEGRFNPPIQVFHQGRDTLEFFRQAQIGTASSGRDLHVRTSPYGRNLG